MSEVLDAETRAHGGQDELRLWLRLLTCTTLIEGRIRTGLRDEFGVTLPRFDVMAQLERAPGDPGMTLGELSRRMMVSNGNVTGLVDRLVDEGLVERSPCAADRRVARVSLTAAGREHFAGMARTHAEWVRAMFGGLRDEELSALMHLLGRLKRSVADAQ